MSASALLLAASAAASVRAASLNLCTDEFLLLIAAPTQIVSVTHLSQNPAEMPLWRQARRYPLNDGSLLSVVSRRPNMIFTMGGGARDRVRLARRLGLEVVDLPYPQSLSDVESTLRVIGHALGRTTRAARVVGQLRQLRRTAPTRAVDTIWLGGGGRSVSAHGLEAQWMRLAGLRQRALRSDRVGLELLLTSPPKVLLRSDYRSGQYSGEQRWLSHPLAKRTRARQTLSTDGRVWTCMGPLMISEVARLRARVSR